MEKKEIRNKVFLSLLFASEPQKINQLLKITSKDDIMESISEIKKMLKEYNIPLQLMEIAGGYRLGTSEYYSDFLKNYFKKERRIRLSKASFEVLTIIAYKQPITIPEINQIRSINSEGSIKTLLEKELIEISGRKDSMGRPLLFSTTDRFLEVFGLNTLEDLPLPIEINSLNKGLDNEDN